MEELALVNTFIESVNKEPKLVSRGEDRTL